MTERELFKIEAGKIGVDISECDTPMGAQFKYGNTRDMFKIWQASANREGYKLVPVEPSDKMKLSAYKQYDTGLSSMTDIYKAMIGAVE